LAFENLLKPPHLKRFLIAVAAAFTAVLVYFTAGHFAVVPGTGALDSEDSKADALGERSILVLPIAGTSNADLSRAVSLEIITLLVSQRDLQVVAPQSAFSSPGLHPSPSVRAFPFGVNWMLEIDSEFEGSELLLSATLMSSEMGERATTLATMQRAGSPHAFIQQVVASLAESLDFEPPGKAHETRRAPPDAYVDYLLARGLLLGGGAGLEAARGLLEQTLAAVPDWAPALAAYAYGLLLQTAGGADGDGTALGNARKLLERARFLDPDLPEAWLYTSMMAHRFDWDWEAADDAAQKALALAPGDAYVLASASTAEFSLGKFEEGIEHLQAAIVLDPLVLSHRLKYGLMLEFGGHRQLAIDAYRELMALDPAFPAVHAYLGRTLVIAGRAEAALPHMEIERSDFWRLYGTTLVWYALNRNDEADLGLERLIEEYGGEAAIQIAEIYAFTGRIEPAFEWLNKALEQRDPGLGSLIGNPLFENLRDDPRWRDLLDALRLPAD